MAEKKAVCGGFYIGDGLEMDGKVLSATGGGDSSNIFVVNVNIEDGSENGTCDKTLSEIKEKSHAGYICVAHIVVTSDMGTSISNLPMEIAEFPDFGVTSIAAMTTTFAKSGLDTYKIQSTIFSFVADNVVKYEATTKTI